MHKILDVRVVLYLEDVQLKIFRAFYLPAFTSLLTKLCDLPSTMMRASATARETR